LQTERNVIIVLLNMLVLMYYNRGYLGEKWLFGKLGVTLLVLTCLVGCSPNSTEQYKKVDSNSNKESLRASNSFFPQGFHSIIIVDIVQLLICLTYLHL